MSSLDWAAQGVEGASSSGFQPGSSPPPSSSSVPSDGANALLPSDSDSESDYYVPGRNAKKRKRKALKAPPGRNTRRNNHAAAAADNEMTKKLRSARALESEADGANQQPDADGAKLSDAEASDGAGADEVEEVFAPGACVVFYECFFLSPFRITLTFTFA